MSIVRKIQITKTAKIGMMMVLLFNCAVLGRSNPPSKIELSYDKEKGSLHVIIKHVSVNMRKHYIRKIEVRKNTESPVPHYFTSQTSASELVVDIPLKVMPNDTIHVEAICSEAGRAEESLVIPAE